MRLKGNIRHAIFQIFGRCPIFSFQIISSKVVGFHLKVTKTQFWTGGIGGFRLFMAFFRFFHAELSLMPVTCWRLTRGTGLCPQSKHFILC